MGGGIGLAGLGWEAGRDRLESLPLPCQLTAALALEESPYSPQLKDPRPRAGHSPLLLDPNAFRPLLLPLVLPILS